MLIVISVGIQRNLCNQWTNINVLHVVRTCKIYVRVSEQESRAH
jgi:hypothetical protein